MPQPSPAKQKKTKEPKIPKSLGACADLYYKTREQRLTMQHELEKFEKLESKLQEHFINKLSKDSTGVSGKVAHIQITSKPVPVVEDWPKFYEYVRKNKAFELLWRRVNAKAVEERWEDKKQVPGVTKFHAKQVSCTKIK